MFDHFVGLALKGLDNPLHSSIAIVLVVFRGNIFIRNLFLEDVFVTYVTCFYN